MTNSNVSPEDFKGALASWASGVTVVTTRVNDVEYGLTVSSFSSLSFDPLCILVCIQNQNRLGSMINDSGSFGVSILAQGQEEISNHFAMPGREPVPSYNDQFPTKVMETGSPLFNGAIGYLDCELHQSIPAGDHHIVIGKVVGASFDDDKEPLLYYRRGYRKVTEI